LVVWLGDASLMQLPAATTCEGGDGVLCAIRPPSCIGRPSLARLRCPRPSSGRFELLLCKTKRVAAKRRSSYFARKPLNTTSLAVQPQLTRLRLTTNKHQLPQNRRPQSRQQNITMTRINISYLLALGLLGTAVASKCSQKINTRQWRQTQ
jgi:hypothetical protein